MSCRCQECGRQFYIDIMIPDNIWEEIRPKDKEKSGGLLCGCCIMNRLENYKKHGIIHARNLWGDFDKDFVEWFSNKLGYKPKREWFESEKMFMAWKAGKNSN